MKEASQKVILREMDSEELEQEATKLVLKRNSEGLTDEEVKTFWTINRYFKQITGRDIVVDTHPQLAS